MGTSIALVPDDTRYAEDQTSSFYFNKKMRSNANSVSCLKQGMMSCDTKTSHNTFSNIKLWPRSKSLENLAYQSTTPNTPTFIDVKVIQEGNATSIDLVRRTASIDAHCFDLAGLSSASRRNSLPAGWFHINSI